MKKIMFNDKYGLTEAVLDGRKTQTRRVINVSNSAQIFSDSVDMYNPHTGLMQKAFKLGGEWLYVTPSYQIDEIVAVAQSYQSIYPNDPCFDRMKKEPGWNNKMFVASGVMPHHIRITNIRVERLQDISEEDCLAEGIYEVKGGFDETNYTYKGIGNSMFGTARCAYMSLIAKVCGRYVWSENPYVFVYEFVKED